jgi:hypothetical protein
MKDSSRSLREKHLTAPVRIKIIRVMECHKLLLSHHPKVGQRQFLEQQIFS